METVDLKTRVLQALGGTDGIPTAPAETRRPILGTMRLEYVAAIHMLRERHRIATAVGNDVMKTEIEGLAGKALHAIDLIDQELAGLEAAHA